MADFKTVKAPSAAVGFWQDDAFLVGLAIAVCVLILGVLTWRRSRREGQSQINHPLADRWDRRASGAVIAPRNRKPPCKWRSGSLSRPRSGGLGKWHCSECGVEAFTTTGKAPAECKKELKPKAL
jgi:hypothetical protein